jgi:transposase
MPTKAETRAEAVRAVAGMVAGGLPLALACGRAGVSPAWYRRWSARFAEAGLDGLDDLPRSGRPPCVRLSDEEAGALRRAYLRSNRSAEAGSMTLAARWTARDPESPLSAEARAAILKPRASKHALPVAVRRACRASAAEVARYRDGKAGLNDGIYTPGWLRMSADGSRRLCPNERWVGDDASVNVGVCVPWTRGGDRCSEKFGVRVARFQLLALIDCATDLCVGYTYVMRQNDAYTAADVVGTFWRVAALRGGMPREMVCEGGAWQAERTLAYLKACGTRLVDAKGRPNQKLVEGWFNRLWSAMSLSLPPSGQIGRFRGEMAGEKDLWMRCRKGAEDPRRHFPMLDGFFRALDGAISYLNTEPVESREYGTWVPAEAYAERGGIFPAQALLASPQGLRRYALPVRERRRVRRGGMVAVRADSPLGWPHDYAFAMRDGAGFDGAEAWVSFDPADPRAGASVELAAGWAGLKAGTVLDEAAACVSAAPLLERTRGGIWLAGVLDARREAAAVKRSSRALVGQRVAAFDGRGVVARQDIAVAEDGSERQAFGFGGREPGAVAASGGYDNEVDFAALEAAAGIA